MDILCEIRFGLYIVGIGFKEILNFSIIGYEKGCDEFKVN